MGLIVEPGNGDGDSFPMKIGFPYFDSRIRELVGVGVVDGVGVVAKTTETATKVIEQEQDSSYIINHMLVLENALLQ